MLAPIQRICRYPLHLSELVKYTPVKQKILQQPQCNVDVTSKSETDTIDCKETFELALGAMKRVTEMVNEGINYWFCDCIYFVLFGDKFAQFWCTV